MMMMGIQPQLKILKSHQNQLNRLKIQKRSKMVDQMTAQKG